MTGRASYGLRPKSLDVVVRARGLRSLDLFLTALAAGGGAAPPGLVVTLPKVSAPQQVSVFGNVLAELEGRLGLAPIPLEVQVETPAAVLALPAVSEGCPQSWSACGASRVRSGHGPRHGRGDRHVDTPQAEVAQFGHHADGR